MLCRTSTGCIRKIMWICNSAMSRCDDDGIAACVFDDTNERFTARERHVSLSAQAIENEMRQSFLHHLPHLNAVCCFQLLSNRFLFFFLISFWSTIATEVQLNARLNHAPPVVSADDRKVRRKVEKAGDREIDIERERANGEHWRCKTIFSIRNLYHTPYRSTWHDTVWT